MSIDENELPPIFRTGKQEKKSIENPLAKATADVLAELSSFYPEQASQDVKQMKELLSQAEDDTIDIQIRQSLRDDFFRKVHDMKGQAVTFGYPLLSEIGTVVCDYLRHKQTMTKGDVIWVRPFVADMEIILQNQLTDEYDEKAKGIKQRLAMMQN